MAAGSGQEAARGSGAGAAGGPSAFLAAADLAALAALNRCLSSCTSVSESSCRCFHTNPCRPVGAAPAAAPGSCQAQLLPRSVKCSFPLSPALPRCVVRFIHTALAVEGGDAFTCCSHSKRSIMICSNNHIILDEICSLRTRFALEDRKTRHIYRPFSS